MEDILRTIEQAEFLDPAAEAGTRLGSKLVPHGPVKDVLTGHWMGHPLHPLLTDVAIGAWTSATILDLIGGRGSARGARRLTAVGLLSAIPTALAGLADWVDTRGPERRVGMVHAASNTAALVAYFASWSARRKGDDNKGKLLALAGGAALSAGGYLGGHLSYRLGAAVDRTVFDTLPQEWTPVLTEAELPAGTPVIAQAGSIDVLLYRNAGEVCAIANKCTHRGGPLNEGDVDAAAGTVTCPWHLSEFELCTGKVVHGPANAPQPRFEARINGGKVEVRSEVPTRFI